MSLALIRSPDNVQVVLPHARPQRNREDSAMVPDFLVEPLFWEP